MPMTSSRTVNEFTVKRLTTQTVNAYMEHSHDLPNLLLRVQKLLNPEQRQFVKMVLRRVNDAQPGQLLCRRCFYFKHPQEFSAAYALNRTGPAWCQSCSDGYDDQRKKQQRKRTSRTRRTILWSDYMDHLAQQEYRCAACKLPSTEVNKESRTPSGRRKQFLHPHYTQQHHIDGLLCHDCMGLVTTLERDWFRSMCLFAYLKTAKQQLSA